MLSLPFEQDCRQLDGALPDALWGEAVLVFRVQPAVLAVEQRDHPHAHAQRRETVQVRLRLGVMGLQLCKLLSFTDVKCHLDICLLVVYSVNMFLRFSCVVIGT